MLILVKIFLDLKCKKNKRQAINLKYSNDLLSLNKFAPVVGSKFIHIIQEKNKTSALLVFCLQRTTIRRRLAKNFQQIVQHLV
jgi:hypothetical protein